MISQTLRDARRYEDAMAQNITPLERPEFHLSPKVGWMNDPNGFSYYKDKFHLFYQYYPYDSQWGPMHWGHAVSDDLLHWEYPPAEDMPENSSPFDFRDPKMWKCEDGTYRCVIVNDRADGKDVVLVSPQDMLPKGFEYHNGDGTLCLIGKFDEETKTFIPEKDQAVDYGIDYYAMQTVEAPDGRRIMIGWMQNWDTCANNRIPKGKWFGQMSLPRELSIKDGRLIQKPIREIEKLRTNKTEYKNVAFEDVIRLDGVDGRCVDMEITLRPADAQNIYKKFAVRFAQNDTYHTAVSFRPYESVLKIDRKFSGSRRAIIHQRRSLVNSENGEIKLRLILDRFSAEIFVNDGEHVMTATIYTDLEADGISFFADGKVEMDVTKYELKL